MLLINITRSYTTSRTQSKSPTLHPCLPLHFLATDNAQSDETRITTVSQIERVLPLTVNLENGVFRICFFDWGLCRSN